MKLVLTRQHSRDLNEQLLYGVRTKTYQNNAAILSSRIWRFNQQNMVIEQTTKIMIESTGGV